MTVSIKKRLGIISLVLLLLLTIFSLPAAQKTLAVTSATTTADWLNLRTGPGVGYSVITTLPYGTSLTVLDTSNANWYKVQSSSGKTGYVNTPYITVAENNSSSDDLETATTTASLNLRSGAGSGYSVISTLPSGTSVTILSKTNASWYRVRTSSNVTGYVNAPYLKITVAPTPDVSGALGTAVTSVDLYLRSGPASGYSALTLLSAGTEVTFLEATNASWYKVKTSANEIGYLNTPYITVTLNNASGDDTETATTTASLNLRSGAGSGYSVIATLPSGTSVTILSKTNASWYHVRTASNVTGYLNAPYLKMTGAETPPSEPTVLTLSKSAFVLGKGAADTFYVDAQNLNGTNLKVTLSDDITAAVTYLKTDGTKIYYTVTAKNAGITDITLSANGVSVTANATVYGFVKTTTGLNVRSGPSTNDTIKTTLSSGTVVELLSAQNSEWYQIRTTGGLEGYVFSEYVSFTTGSSGTVTLSQNVATIPQGMTLYVKATTSVSGTSVTWATSNAKVATVSEGYIYAAGIGTATITARDASGTNRAVCTVTVSQAEPVKFAYTSPNTVGAGTQMELVAITDSTRSAVRFEVKGKDGTWQSYEVTTFTADDNAEYNGMAENKTRIWKQPVTFADAGCYAVRIYSKCGDTWSTTYRETSAFIVSTTDKTSTSSEERRISDEMLQIIASFEGYSRGVYPDTLAYNLPTTGYGYVLSVGEKFYNNMTRSEAWAMLCNVTNTRSYTTEINKFIKNNNLKASQCNFDAMVSFSYNVGAGYWNSTDDFDVRNIVLNAVDITELSFGESGLGATMTEDANLYDAANGTLGGSTFEGANCTVFDATFDSVTNTVWYQVKFDGDTLYWTRGAYVKFTNSSALTHDLKYTDSIAFGSEMLNWHRAGGVCIPGLLYRRLAESKVYSFANYAEASPSSSRYRVNTYKYIYPTCLASYER